MSARFDSRVSRAVRLVFTVLMTFAWCGGVPHLLSTAVAQPAPGALTEAQLQRQEKSLAVLRRMVELGEEQLRKPDANPADVPATAQQLGNEPQRLFAFVRDEVAYEPYRGILRGARGALAARAANALDKSLLLHELLGAGGHESRIVRGQLPAEQAAALVGQFLSRDPLKGPLGTFAGPGGTVQIPAEFVRRSGMSEASLTEYLDRSRRQTETFIADAWKVTDAQAKYLVGQLAKANVSLGRAPGEWRDELASRAADHAWVELRQGDQWIPLDPSFAKAEFGQPGGTEGTPIDEKALDTARHTLRFTLTYRAGDGASPKEHVLLDEALPVEDLYWDSLAFTIDPAEALPPPSKIIAMNPDEGIKLLTSIKTFQGVLTSGGKRFASRVFDLKGGVFDVAQDGRVKGASQIGGQVGGLFGGGLGGGKEPAADEGSFLDLAVTLTIQSPGAEPTKQQRVLLTKADLAGDHVLSPILGWQVLVQSGVIAAAVNDFETLSRALPVLDPMVTALAENDPARAIDKMGTMRPTAYPATLADLALWRQTATARLVQENPQLRPLWDRPQVVIAEQRFCNNRKTGHGCGRAAIDIVDNAISMIPADPAASAQAAQAAMRQGIFDTAAEALMLQAIAGSATDATVSAIADAEQARQAGDLIMFAPADAPANAVASVPESDRAWIAQFEPAGRKILAPPVAVASGAMWWSLDPETGTILGRGAGGRGQTMTEYAVQIWIGNICMIVHIINFLLDARAGGWKATDKQGTAFVINMAGCLLGAGGGAIGVKAAGAGATVGTQSIINLVNAGIAGAVSLGSAQAAR